MRLPPIDWNAEARKAEGLTRSEIHYALLDILKTLPFADKLDRIDGGGRGGRYRDQASVLRRERRLRR